VSQEGCSQPQVGAGQHAGSQAGSGQHCGSHDGVGQQLELQAPPDLVVRNCVSDVGRI
jgi:hypothetical protein